MRSVFTELLDGFRHAPPVAFSAHDPAQTVLRLDAPVSALCNGKRARLSSKLSLSLQQPPRDHRVWLRELWEEITGVL